MAEGKVEFELVAPESLLVSEAVDMVVVPGSEGDFGVLPRHAPLISGVRPGVIHVHDGGQITKRIFVAGGFAEVTPTRCTVCAERGVPVEQIDRSAVETELKAARDDLTDAESDEERDAAERAIQVAEAMLAAAAQ